jgi:H+-transporting ATPase
MTRHAILTPLLMVLIMITGDFLGMSLTTDNVRPSPAPNAWQIGNLTIAGVVMGIGTCGPPAPASGFSFPLSAIS